MFLGDHAGKWRRGAHALERAMEYVPEHVEAAVRTRLTRILKIKETFSEREKRIRWLTNDALDPLRGINHSSAAQIGERILRRYNHLGGRDGDRTRDWHFVDDIDYARGRIALYGQEGQLTVLLQELAAESNVTRYRAAHALRNVIVETPEAVRDTLLARLADERDWLVLERLLLDSYHLIEPYPDELLAALQRSIAFNFREPLATNGQLLVLLGNLAGKLPSEVANLLPRRLEAHEAWTRAFLSEILAYAWWRCGEQIAEVREHLAALSDPDLEGVLDECIPFALRGSAIALLAKMCIEEGIPADELTGRQIFYPNFGKDFPYVETVEFFQNNASLLRQHHSFGQFEQLLIRCLHEEERVQVHPIQPVREAQFRCASMCLELLALTAVLMPDHLPLLNSLPRNWQAIRAATRLLEMGRSEDSIVRFARESFAGLESGGTMQAVEERRRCQAQLALLEADLEQALREQQESALHFLFLQSSGNSLGLSVLATKQPDRLLAHLDASVRTDKDLPTLYYLVEEARSWQSLLIARVYARMFSRSAISTEEAGDLCEQILAALRSLPDSSLRQEYEAIYSAIAGWLKGNAPPAPVLPQLPPDADRSVLRNSHEIA